VLAPATLAALPSTRAIPDRDVFYVTHPIRSIPIESRTTSRKSCPVRAQNARRSNVTCAVVDPATFFYCAEAAAAHFITEKFPPPVVTITRLITISIVS